MKTTLLKNVGFSDALSACSECLERLPCQILDTDALRGHITAMLLPEQITFHREVQVSVHDLKGATRVVVEARGAGIQIFKTMRNEALEDEFIKGLQAMIAAGHQEPAKLAIAV